MEPSSEIPQLALLGCGIFARDAYIPILKDLKDHLFLRFIWSRSEVSATKLLAKVHEFAPQAQAEWGEDGMERILSSPHVHCCAVVLPILSQPKIVAKVLQSGKHVLQEKPIAATLYGGIVALRTFAELNVQKSQSPIWAVAENFRFEPAFVEAQEMIKELGTMLFVQVDIEVAMNSGNKYFHSEWRPNLPGAFITDCGVHYVAALRTMLGARNIVSVTGIATHRDQSVPPPDTLTTLLTLDNGCSGTMMISFSSPNNKSTWRVVCSKGTVEVERGFYDNKLGYTVKLIPFEGKSSLKFIPVQGLQEELKAFAKDILNRRIQSEHKPDFRSSPSEALHDLSIVENALLSDGEASCCEPPIIRF
ncbi:unnamed protein product [Calypogeia fissa]